MRLHGVAYLLAGTVLLAFPLPVMGQSEEPCPTVNITRVTAQGEMRLEQAEAVNANGEQIYARQQPPTPPEPGADAVGDLENPHFWEPGRDLRDCIADMGRGFRLGLPDVIDPGGLADYLCRMSRRYTGTIARKAGLGGGTHVYRLDGTEYGDLPTKDGGDVDIDIRSDEFGCDVFPNDCGLRP